MNSIKKLFGAFWILFLCKPNWTVWCSGKTGSEVGGYMGSLWGLVSSMASSVIKGRPSIEDGPSYGKLFQFERILQAKEKEMADFMKSVDEKLFEHWNPIKFPEASAFSALFIRDIGSHLDTWMDLTESKKLREGSRVLSQHILWIRSTGSRAATSYFIYRPSFLAELDSSSSLLPHLKYHVEAQETSQNVIKVIEEYPNDQIVFVGLQSGGAIAMLHAWMVVAAVPIVYRNLKQFKGELHQIKIFLFDSDCVLSETHAPNYPIPSWDIIRFYSGMSDGISPDFCRYSMKPIGLSYAFTPGWMGNRFSGSSNVVDRVKFVDYYDKASEMEVASENIDNGIIDESFDDDASIAASDISMSVDGHNYQPSHHSRPGSTRKQSSSSSIASVPVKTIEDVIKPGIALLTHSVNLSQFFFQNLKEIYRTHQSGYLRRNVNGCAAAMQKNLINSLLGKEKESPVVEKGIKDVTCKVDVYNEKSKVALITCTLISKESVESSILRFRTHVQNDMDAILTQNNILIVENDWEEISMTGRTVSTSESFSVPTARQHQQLKQAYDEEVYFDDRSIVSGFQDKAEQWATCLDELFQQSSHLNFINPGEQNLQGELASVAASAKGVPGRSFLSIQLPFSSSTAVCEYSLKTKPQNYFQLYSVSSSMFFSIFSEAIESFPFPPSCTNILEPPSIPRKHIGNAETIGTILNGYFNSDSASEINHKNIIVNGLEIQESTTNLLSNNPYEIFKPALCGKLAKCLAQNILDKLYDCNSHLTLWAGRHHCPEICAKRPPGLGGRGLHLCSRVVNCGDGIYLGFRGGKWVGNLQPLNEEFSLYSMMGESNPPAYYAAFHLRHVEGWASTLKKPFRFAIFFNDDAKNLYITGDSATTAPTSSASVRSNSGLLKKKVSNYIQPSSNARNLSTDDDDDYDFEHRYHKKQESERQIGQFTVEQEDDGDGLDGDFKLATELGNEEFDRTDEYFSIPLGHDQKIHEKETVLLDERSKQFSASFNTMGGLPSFRQENIIVIDELVEEKVTAESNDHQTLAPLLEEEILNAKVETQSTTNTVQQSTTSTSNTANGSRKKNKKK